jgi:hypothetical protein
MNFKFSVDDNVRAKVDKGETYNTKNRIGLVVSANFDDIKQDNIYQVEFKFNGSYGLRYFFESELELFKKNGKKSE